MGLVVHSLKPSDRHRVLLAAWQLSQERDRTLRMQKYRFLCKRLRTPGERFKVESCRARGAFGEDIGAENLLNV